MCKGPRRVKEYLKWGQLNAMVGLPCLKEEKTSINKLSITEIGPFEAKQVMSIRWDKNSDFFARYNFF